MPAGNIVRLDLLRHGCCGVARGMGNLMRDICVDLNTVCSLHQRAEGEAEVMLRGSHLMVVLVAGQTHFEHGRDHFAADVDGAVDGCDGEIADLGARTVGKVAAVIAASGVGLELVIFVSGARCNLAMLKSSGGGN